MKEQARACLYIIIQADGSKCLDGSPTIQVKLRRPTFSILKTPMVKSSNGILTCRSRNTQSYMKKKSQCSFFSLFKSSKSARGSTSIRHVRKAMGQILSTFYLGHGEPTNQVFYIRFVVVQGEKGVGIFIHPSMTRKIDGRTLFLLQDYLPTSCSVGLYQMIRLFRNPVVIYNVVYQHLLQVIQKG